jgi:hypothetical protein
MRQENIVAIHEITLPVTLSYWVGSMNVYVLHFDLKESFSNEKSRSRSQHSILLR